MEEKKQRAYAALSEAGERRKRIDFSMGGAIRPAIRGGGRERKASQGN